MKNFVTFKKKLTTSPTAAASSKVASLQCFSSVQHAISFKPKAPTVIDDSGEMERKHSIRNLNREQGPITEPSGTVWQHRSNLIRADSPKNSIEYRPPAVTCSQFACSCFFRIRDLCFQILLLFFRIRDLCFQILLSLYHSGSIWDWFGRRGRIQTRVQPRQQWH